MVVRKASQVSDFLKINHVQGPVRRGTAYCLEHEGQVVAAMVFTSVYAQRGTKKDPGTVELARYATSCNVPGGASKLLENFIKDNAVKSVVSYADLSVFTGGMYEQLGFVAGAKSKSYKRMWDYNELDVRTKQSTSRKALEKAGLLDPLQTETQNCQRLGLIKIPHGPIQKYVKTV